MSYRGAPTSPLLQAIAGQMRLGLHIFGMSLQEATVYRLESAIWFVFDLVPPLVTLAIWLAAYQETTEIGGYSLGAMLAYYVGVIGLRALITTHQEHGIGDEVRKGMLSNLLVKPLNYWLYWFANELAWKAWRLLLVTPVILALVVWFRHQITWPASDQLAAALLASLLAFGLCFLLKQCLGYIAFWLVQIDGVLQAYWLVSVFLSGELVPLDLLPDGVRVVAQALPFAYLYYFPLQVALGKVSGPTLWSGLAMQAGWAVLAGLVSVVLWRRGLRHFEGVGL